MAKARAIVKRRKAVRNIRKITKTMQMIATAKFQKALKRSVGTKPFTTKVRELVGELGLHLARYGVADLGMLVAAGWRGRGVGTALLAEAIDRARKAGAHKIALQVWPHNAAAIALYERFGFEREGLLRRHYRRRSGELWDAVVMGLRLD